MLFVINNPEVYKSPNSNTYMYVEAPELLFVYSQYRSAQMMQRDEMTN